MDLITGGSGYFGSLLVNHLISKGRSCRILDLNLPDPALSSVETLQGDIRDEGVLNRACRNVDVIYHTAAQVPLTKDKAFLRSVNIEGTRRLLRMAREFNVRKVIFLSSSAVFGSPKSNPIAQDAPTSPQEAYGHTKVEAEGICREFINQGLDITIIRPRTIMGHGRLGIFQLLFDWIYEGYNVPVLGRGHNRYQFIHADDLSEACFLAAKQKGPHVYNCGTDRFGTMREALENLCFHAGTGSKVVSVPMWPAVMGMKGMSWLGLSPLEAYHALMYGRSCHFDIEPAQSALHWTPKYANNDMFRESYDWYVEHRDEVLKTTGKSHHRSPLKEGFLGMVKRCL